MKEMTTERHLTEKKLLYLVWAVSALPGILLSSNFEAHAQASATTASTRPTADNVRTTGSSSRYEGRGPAVSTVGSAVMGDPVRAVTQNPDRNVVQPEIAKSALPFPCVSVDGLRTLAGVQSESTRSFPSAIEVRGNARGLLLHAQKDTKYDLLSPVSLWLESGPLLVAVRAPSDMSLIATKFGDVCVSTGGDALLERGDGTLRIINLSSGKGSVDLVLHDRQWRASPWSVLSKGNAVRVSRKNENKFESGSLAVSPGYELVVSDHSLELSEAKPADAIGRRDFKVIGDNGRFLVSEVCIENLVQGHDLVRNLKVHGAKANSVLSDIFRVAAQYRAKQGEEGFDRIMPLVVKPSESLKKPDSSRSKPPKAPVATSTPKKQSERTAPAGKGPTDQNSSNSGITGIGSSSH